MASVNTITMTGMNTTLDKLANMTGAVDKQVIRALRQIGQLVQAGAQRRVPVSQGGGKMSGNLRRNIHYQVNPAIKDVRIGVDSENAEYGVFIEFGTDRIAGGAVKKLGLGMVTDAQAIRSWPALGERGGTGQQMPFLRPAAMAARDEALALFENALRRGTK